MPAAIKRRIGIALILPLVGGLGAYALLRYAAPTHTKLFRSTLRMNPRVVQYEQDGLVFTYLWFRQPVGEVLPSFEKDCFAIGLPERSYTGETNCKKPDALAATWRLTSFPNLPPEAEGSIPASERTTVIWFYESTWQERLLTDIKLALRLP
jgi:hypothetical protein